MSVFTCIPISEGRDTERWSGRVTRAVGRALSVLHLLGPSKVPVEAGPPYRSAGSVAGVLEPCVLHADVATSRRGHGCQSLTVASEEHGYGCTAGLRCTVLPSAGRSAVSIPGAFHLMLAQLGNKHIKGGGLPQSSYGHRSEVCPLQALVEYSHACLTPRSPQAAPSHNSYSGPCDRNTPGFKDSAMSSSSMSYRLRQHLHKYGIQIRKYITV